MAGTGGNVESHVISDAVEPIHRRLDQMNKTLVQVMDNSRIHGLEQRIDSDSQASEHRQRSSHPERSTVESTHWNHPFNDLQLYDQIPISWDREDELEDPEHFELPPLRTNNDFTNLTDYQLDDYLYYYQIDVDDQSTRETKMHCLRYFIIGRSKSCHAASDPV
ncbi:uncharacterized protein F5891DRAFT_1246710 [Suillus fuscotomentosus]|uniref:Mug135-like C-terminal domain-containing protein n=1 Tax=Suillus fuscotomentosus TaxID=1912939 RepID=A0AAD4DYT2_9AGAM|nr:uncharacterized protein F5891DRAFT_1246710 [Suillus fuscotomentosus]KAG1896616.1 hypothetical protein F5891DRAFT_1246710 [Suillus fuscotomentosus]